ncbi:MAG: peptide-methionine (S)-S-oxide reductase MsrA [Acidobacteria bacterium]|nr:peptide-methionine (S)-S-oxide reductase MsrA [Acidobacteriota bacterium]
MYRLPLLLPIAALLAFAASGPFPDPAVDAPKAAAKTRAVAVFAGGCFWCTEAVFESVAGVEKVVSGYSGGKASDAQYKVVSEGRTQHAEAIEITYDTSKVTFGQLLKVFFAAAHDPTTLDRQGPDWGKQYRSAVFYNSDEQKKIVDAYVAQLGQAGVFKDKIVTQIVPLEKFYAAEGYHQDFVRNNPGHGYVMQNVPQKIKKLKTLTPELVKK